MCFGFRSEVDSRRYSIESLSTPECQRKNSCDSYGTQCSGCYPETSLNPDWPIYTRPRSRNDESRLSFSEASGKTTPEEFYERRVITPDIKFLTTDETKDCYSFFVPNSEDVDLTNNSTISDSTSTYHPIRSKTPSQDTISSNNDYESVPNLSSPSIIVDSSELFDDNTFSECNIDDIESVKLKTELDKTEVENKDDMTIKMNGIFEKEEQKLSNTLQKMLTQSLVESSRSRRLSIPCKEDDVAPSWMISPELLALRHNLTFPESATASPIVRRAQRCCRKFSVDLSKYR